MQTLHEFGHMQSFCCPRWISCRDLLYNMIPIGNKPVLYTVKYYSFFTMYVEAGEIGLNRNNQLYPGF